MSDRPPTIDPVAAHRWAQRVPEASPWLHEEVARRMEARLQWIARTPQAWLHWGALQGGLQAQGLLAARYPQAQAYLVEPNARQTDATRKTLQPRWWQWPRKGASSPIFEAPRAPVQMVWANMALHMEADPLAMIRQWHQWLEVDGFLMFSCFGPDTLRELRSLYTANGWSTPSHEFTDMHDWGDMLVHSGFAEPVMDMERITLTYSTPQGVLDELRGLGRNLHPQRFGALRGRGWRENLERKMQQELASASEPGRLQLTFEIVYGHAFKPQARIPVTGHSSISLDDMRKTLGIGKGVPR